MTTCTPTFTNNETSPYSQKDSPFSNKESSFTQKNPVLSQKDSVFDKLCLNYTAKIFQDGVAFVMQNGDQYIFND